MIVYIGVAIVLLFSWLYILGMGWHMNTLPFIGNTTMSMDMPSDSMDMNDNDMTMNHKSGMITKILTWIPPMGNMWALTDFSIVYDVGCNDDCHDDSIYTSNAHVIYNSNARKKSTRTRNCFDDDSSCRLFIKLGTFLVCLSLSQSPFLHTNGFLNYDDGTYRCLSCRFCSCLGWNLSIYTIQRCLFKCLPITVKFFN